MDNTLQFAYKEARDLVRLSDSTRYIATLFAPENCRHHLFALYAFNVEITRIRDVITQPLPGEVRLQWWRDVIEAETTSANPIAASLLDTIIEKKLPRQAFLDMVDAHIFDLYDDMMPTWRDLEGYCGETNSALFRLATLILSNGKENNTAEICGHAGIAYALTMQLVLLPKHTRRGQIYLPQEAFDAHNLKRETMLVSKPTPEILKLLAQTRSKIWDHLAQTHALGRSLDPTLSATFLPLAVLKPILKRMTKTNYQPFEYHDLAQWQRIMAMVLFRV